MNAMANPPSIAFPESAERCASITSAIQAATGLDEAVLEHLVRSFYATARRDEVIGHLSTASLTGRSNVGVGEPVVERLCA